MNIRETQSEMDNIEKGIEMRINFLEISSSISRLEETIAQLELRIKKLEKPLKSAKQAN